MVSSSRSWKQSIFTTRNALVKHTTKPERMELDHLFLFTSTPAEAAVALRRFGLTEGAPNTHPGQGTSCRRFFFRNAYLELIWMHSEEEAQSPGVADTKVWERAHYTRTGYCPFGLCFRSDTLIFPEGWHYHPPYLPEGLYINVAPNTSHPSEPMLFELPFSNTAPKDYPPGRQQPLQHEKGFNEITRLTLTLPTTKNVSPSLQKVITHGPIAVVAGRAYLMELELDGGSEGKTQEFTSLLPLVIRW